MKRQSIGFLLALIASSAFALDAVHTPAGDEGPAQTAIAPPKGPGPVVLVLSGIDGPGRYEWLAKDVAGLGYYVVLLDGNDVFSRQKDGAANLRKAMERAQHSPHAMPGKSAVIGLSLGGGAAIAYAATMLERVSAVVAFYPMTSFTPDISVVARRFKLPVLVLTGAADTHNNCCLVESMRRIESAAREINAAFELVVYPYGKHVFNINGPNYQRDYEQDSWTRTVEMLRKHQPLPAVRQN